MAAGNSSSSSSTIVAPVHVEVDVRDVSNATRSGDVAGSMLIWLAEK
jgi:hypothetical protein